MFQLTGPQVVGFYGSYADCPLCGGLARIVDGRHLLSPPPGSERNEARVSAVTAAELLRLARVARAVQEGRPGALERFDHVLAEAPDPIRRLGERWTRDQKLALAGIIIALVALLLPLVKSADGVTEDQLVEIIDQLVDQSDGPGQQGQPEEATTGGAGDTGAGEGGAPSDTSDGDRNGSAPKMKHREDVGRPHEQ